MEKDYFDHVVFRRDFLYSVRLHEGCSNSILLYEIIYFAASWNFASMVSELEKYV